MSTDLFTNLGLQFVNPTEVHSGLKLLKPSAEPQIFSVILRTPTLANTMIKYERHNFYGQLKKFIRCNGGACCVKANQYSDWLKSLPEGDPRKKQSNPKSQTRYMLPVVLYQGKNANVYGGPIEVRYIDIAWNVYTQWDQARAAVNETIAPFYERDFIMTEDSQIKGVPVMTHLETRAKWLTDAAINAEVMKIIGDPKFAEDYVKKVPAQYSDSDFLHMWNVAMQSQVAAQTEAEKMLQQQPVQQTTPLQAIQPVQLSPAPVQVAPQQVAVQPVQQPVDMNVMNTAPVLAQTIAQPEVNPVQQPDQLVQPVQPMPTMGLPVTTTTSEASVGVPFTPQNIITGAYSTGGTVNTIEPAAIMNMAPASVPVQPAPTPIQSIPQQPVQPAAEQTAPTPAPMQAEIELANIGNLDAIINSLPQV